MPNTGCLDVPDRCTQMLAGKIRINHKNFEQAFVGGGKVFPRDIGLVGVRSFALSLFLPSLRTCAPACTSMGMRAHPLRLRSYCQQSTRKCHQSWHRGSALGVLVQSVGVPNVRMACASNALAREATPPPPRPQGLCVTLECCLCVLARLLPPRCKNVFVQLQDRNRALEGDQVIVLLKDKADWKVLEQDAQQEGCRVR